MLVSDIVNSFNSMIHVLHFTYTNYFQLLLKIPVGELEVLVVEKVVGDIRV